MDDETATQRAFSSHTLLHVYFNPPQSMGGGSKSGSVLTQAELFSARTRRCPLCERAERALDEWIANSKKWDAGKLWNGLYLLAEKGTPFAAVCPPPSQQDCRRCLNTGFVEGRQRGKKVTRHPTGSSKRGSVPRLPVSMADSAQATTIMRRVARESQIDSDVLTAHYGDAGNYAENNLGMRLLAVVTLTPTCRESIQPAIVLRPKLRTTGVENEDGTPEQVTETSGEALLRHLKEWRTSADPERAALWQAAEDEADAMLCDARETWEACCYGH